LNGNKIAKRIIPKDYVAVKIWEVCMPKTIVIVAHHMTNPGKTQIEINLRLLFFGHENSLS
jgi:hypothetical protein